MLQTLEVVDQFYRAPASFLSSAETSPSRPLGKAASQNDVANRRNVTCKESERKIFTVLARSRLDEQSLKVAACSTVVSHDTRKAFHEKLSRDEPLYCGIVWLTEMANVQLALRLSHHAQESELPDRTSNDLIPDSVIELSSNRMVLFDTSTFTPELLFGEKASREQQSVVRIVKVHRTGKQSA
jgi:hypothetical protein